MLTQAAHKEQWLLKLSFAFTLTLSVTTIAFGLLIHSKSVLFDGFYSFIEAGMTAISLLIARLIARGDDDRFQFGYWHLEPLLALVHSLVLAFACTYAAIDGLNGILTGGRLLEFDTAVLFYLFAATAALLIFLFLRKSGRHLGSQLLNLDARSWLISAILSATLCLGFVLGGALSGTAGARFAPYVDPAALMLVSLALLPLPLRTIWKVAHEILMIAPDDLDTKVYDLAEDIAGRYGFRKFNSHVMRSGRQHFIEIGFVAASGEITMSFAELDRIRLEIAEAMGGISPGYWLTVDFTADDRWV